MKELLSQEFKLKMRSQQIRLSRRAAPQGIRGTPQEDEEPQTHSSPKSICLQSGRPGFHPWVRSPGERNGTPLQYSCLENPMDREAGWAAVHGVAKSQTGLSDFTFTFHFHALEKEMAANSSVLAWKIPGMGEPGRLLSMGSHRVGHN